MFEFKILERYKNARTGEFYTRNGKLQTPELAFVATEAEIKAIPRGILKILPVKYLIVNTFHIWVKNILEKIQRAGGVHQYADYPHITASDSGGFQVFSMGFGKSHNVGKIGGMFPGKNIESNDKDNPLTITEEGVKFPFNGQTVQLTPEKSMEIQRQIKADIMFAFDECTSPLNSKEYTKTAMERTHRWMLRCISQIKNSKLKIKNFNLKVKNNEIGEEKSEDTSLRATWEVRSPAKRDEHAHWSGANSVSSASSQALFAIVQGGYFQDLRKISAEFMAKLDVPGYGIGGSLGTTEDEVRSVLEWTIPYLPEEKPRHLLGIGKVKDLFDGIERGVDLFDCVIPTREARHKVIYTKKGKLALRKFRNSDEVIEKNCNCITCKEKITWKMLNEFFTKKDPRAFMYATIHNIQFFTELTKEIRGSITKGNFMELKSEYLSYY